MGPSNSASSLRICFFSGAMSSLLDPSLPPRHGGAELQVYLLAQQGWDDFSQAIGSIPAWAFLAAFACLFGSRLTTVGRWLALLRAADVQITVWDAFKLVFAGLFAANFLPTTIGGDVVRLAGAVQLRLDGGIVTASLIVDRLVGMAGMATLLPLELPRVLREGLPALSEVKLADLFAVRWYPIENYFGILPLLTGSLIVTVGAMLVAIPFGIGTAVFLSEIAPRWLREILKPLVELLGGLPSVVLGFLGILLLSPFLRGFLNLPTGLTALAGSLLLGGIAVPTVVSIAEDALDAVPRSYRDAARTLGDDVAALEADLAAHRLEALEVLVDRAGADGAPPGEGNPRSPVPGDQGPEHEHGGAHRLDHVVGGFRPPGLPRVDAQNGRLPLPGLPARNRRPHPSEQLPEGVDVPQEGGVRDLHGPLREQRRRHDREDGVLRPRHPDGARKRPASFDVERVQDPLPTRP